MTQKLQFKKSFFKNISKSKQNVLPSSSTNDEFVMRDLSPGSAEAVSIETRLFICEQAAKELNKFGTTWNSQAESWSNDWFSKLSELNFDNVVQNVYRQCNVKIVMDENGTRRLVSDDTEEVPQMKYRFSMATIGLGNYPELGLPIDFGEPQDDEESLDFGQSTCSLSDTASGAGLQVRTTTVPQTPSVFGTPTFQTPPTPALVLQTPPQNASRCRPLALPKHTRPTSNTSSVYEPDCTTPVHMKRHDYLSENSPRKSIPRCPVPSVEMTLADRVERFLFDGHRPHN